jgi:hypothetical protein
VEPRPTRLSARLRVRDRIRQGISLRRPLPSEAAVDEAHLAVSLRVERDDAEVEAAERERADLNEAVPVLHTQWNLVDAQYPRPGRLGGRLFSRALRLGRRVFRPVFNQQTEYNAANARAMSALMNRSLRQEEIVETIAGQAFDAIGSSLRGHTEALLELDRALAAIERDVSRVTPIDDEVDHLAFAERFRGSEAEAKERLRPHVDRLRAGDGEVVDLAAGRGELLELLVEAGIPSRGFETAVALIDRCREQGLPVERRDPLSALEDVDPGALGGVAAIGLVGALEPGAVVRLVRLASKALKPGGVLLLDHAEAAGFGANREYSSELVAWLLGQEGFESVEDAAGAVSGRRA